MLWRPQWRIFLDCSLLRQLSLPATFDLLVLSILSIVVAPNPICGRWHPASTLHSQDTLLAAAFLTAKLDLASVNQLIISAEIIDIRPVRTQSPGLHPNVSCESLRPGPRSQPSYMCAGKSSEYIRTTVLFSPIQQTARTSEFAPMGTCIPPTNPPDPA